MGELPSKNGVPPLTNLPAQDGSASNKGTPEGALVNFQWPPSGWPMFACVTRRSGMALRSGNRNAESDYLKYEVTCDENGIYQLEILSGAIDRAGTSLHPVMGMRFAAREDWFDETPQKSVLDMHVAGQRLIPERGAILRIILAMTFIISRIDRGLAPSPKRVLNLYRLG